MKILIIEDDQSLVATLKDMLEGEGYEVDYYYSLEDIEDYIVLNDYNLIILDLMLGTYNGLEFLQMVRDEIYQPIIILTAKDTKEDMLKGFNLGADDYVTKPFDLDLLLARIKSRFRGDEPKEVKFLNTSFNLSTGVVSTRKEAISLTNTELEILKILFASKGQILSKENIINRILPGGSITDKAVVSHIYNIRKKLLQIDGDDPIENKWGVGYLWKER